MSAITLIKQRGDSFFVRHAWEKISFTQDPRVFHMFASYWSPAGVFSEEMLNQRSRPPFLLPASHLEDVVIRFAKLNLFAVVFAQKLSEELRVPRPAPEEWLQPQDLSFVRPNRERSESDGLLVRSLDRQISKVFVSQEELQEEYGARGFDRDIFDHCLSNYLFEMIHGILEREECTRKDLYPFLFDKFDILNLPPVNTQLAREILVP